jgi:hypothetical protein
MNARSLTYDWTTCGDSPNAISLPASESGPTPCASPDGPMTDLFGREVVLAPVSQRLAKAEGLQTLVTSGLIGRDSPASADLQRSLENRLMTRLDTAGSTLFKLTWKGRTTPLGRRYLERAASARRTSGSGCTSWPTPRSVESGHTTGNPSRALDRRARLEDVVHASGWVSPTERDHSRGILPPRETDTGVPVVGAGLAGTNPDGSERDRTDRLSSQATLTVSGETRIGYSARDGIVTIGNGAQLNPEHSRWLMGLPAVFSSCADTVTRSARRSPRSSSKRALKP